jgi:hypothetical protein
MNSAATTTSHAFEKLTTSPVKTSRGRGQRAPVKGEHGQTRSVTVNAGSGTEALFLNLYCLPFAESGLQ